MSTSDLILTILAVAGAITLPIVVRLRRKSHRIFLDGYAREEVCEHLRPAFELLRSRGHFVRRAGQRNPELPIELHLAPRFDPQAIYDELKLADPVFVSERKVLYCREDEVELHPIR